MLNKLNFSRKDNHHQDPLTEVLDRGSFLNVLGDILSDNNSNVDYVFGIARVERFKLINHSYGYKAGDYALNVVAKTMSLELDEGTIVGRLGNTEFGFICKKKNTVVNH